MALFAVTFHNTATNSWETEYVDQPDYYTNTDAIDSLTRSLGFSVVGPIQEVKRV